MGELKVFAIVEIMWKILSDVRLDKIAIQEDHNISKENTLKTYMTHFGYMPNLLRRIYILEK